MSVRELRDRSQVIAGAMYSVVQHRNGKTRNLHAIDVPSSNHVSRANIQLLIFGYDQHSRLRGVSRKEILVGEHFRFVSLRELRERNMNVSQTDGYT